MFVISILHQCALQDIQMALISLDYVVAEGRRVNIALEHIYNGILLPLPCEYKM